MTLRKYNVGPIAIILPDENQGYFSIFEDLAELFDTPYQSDAVKVLKASIRDVRPQPSIDYESDYTSITTTNIKSLIAIVKAIATLCERNMKVSFLLSEADIISLEEAFSDAKKNRPKPREWNTGDIFSIPLNDGTFSYGQVLDKKYCTCALFEIRSNNLNVALENFNESRVVTVLHLSNGDLLNNGNWTVLFNTTTLIDPNCGTGGRFGDIGSKSYGQCRIMSDLANSWWGLLPWNAMYDEKYYDGLLLNGVLRPKTAIILQSEERARYREQNF
jgi:hypothetical protein